MTNLKFHVSHIVIILFLSGLLSAQNSEIFFTQTDIKDGLPGNHPVNILEDRFGYLWINSETGLFKYDGYDYKNFDWNEYSTDSVDNDFVYDLCEDSKGRIWLTLRNGFVIYNYHLDRLINYNEIPDSIYDDFRKSGVDLAASKHGEIYITSNSKYIYQIDDNDKFGLISINGEKEILKENAKSITVDKMNRLWIGQTNLISIYDPNSNSIKHVQLPVDKNDKNMRTGIKSIYNYKDKEYWFGSMSGEIYVADINNPDEVLEYKQSESLKNILGKSVINDFFISEKQELWIVTDDFKTGIIIVDLVTGKTVEIKSEYGVNGKLSGDRIHQIFKDRSNTFWFPTGRRGMSRYDPSANKFDYLFRNETDQKLTYLNYYYELPTGEYLLIDRSGILKLINPNSKEVNIIASINKNNSINGISTFIKHNENNLLFLAYDEWIYNYNISDRKVTKVKTIKNSDNYSYGKGIFGKDGKIWLPGSYEDKTAIMSLDIKTGNLTPHFPIENEPVRPRFQYTYSLTQDKFGFIWIGTNGKGFYKFNPETEEFVKIDYPQLRLVRSSIESKDGNIWAGSDKGVIVLSQSGKVLKKITAIDGLLHDKIDAIVEDNKENIWVITERGISKINRNTYAVRNFDFSDGFPYNELNYMLKVNDKGELLFISGNNLVVFNTNNSQDNNIEPIVNIEYLEFPGDTISKYHARVYNDKAVELLHYQNDLLIKYIGIHYSRSKRINYKYILEGYDTDWQNVGSLRSARYTNLSPGNYKFMVKAKNADGIWTTNAAVLTIVINSPWWKTSWAYLIYFILGISFLMTLRKIELTRKLKNSKIKESQLRAEAAELQAKAAEAQSRIIQAENERKSNELEEARQLQLSMLPKDVPQIANLDIAAYMKTATEVGGDYYDFSSKIDGSLNICLGDATGHGMKAGTLVSMMKSLFTAESIKLGIEEFYDSANTTLKKMALDKMMMAFAMININNEEIKIANAGIPPIYIFRNSKKIVEEINLNGLPIGAMKNSKYDIYESKVTSGDTILMLSDGMPELQNMNNEMYGYERLTDVFQNNASKSSEEIISILKDEGSNWVNGKDPDDDVTFVVIKVK